MESAGLRRRDRNNNHTSTIGNTGLVGESNTAVIEDSVDQDIRVPRYTIDLSLPPVERYQHVASDFKSQVVGLPLLFDELVRDRLPNVLVNKATVLASLILRRVYNREENEELRGISRIAGVEMWLLVAFNVLLDMFMGCTSGGVRIDYDAEDTRMVHFRTLDWGMDPLRKLVVHLDFVEKAQGKVMASSLGYFGYVGVLTGVRKGLSMSLNFRPNHNENSGLGNFRFYSHIILVLLGYRASISSLLRQCLLPHVPSSSSDLHAQDLQSIETTMPNEHTTAAYLIFSDGNKTLVMEKDRVTAVSRSADDFITITNHDIDEETHISSPQATRKDTKILRETGMQDMVEESVCRKSALVKMWETYVRKTRPNSSKRFAKPRQVLNVGEIRTWIDTYPITNEETHFTTIMDPKAGEFVYVRRYIDPVEPA